MSATGRVLYRQLVRELGKHHVEARAKAVAHQKKSELAKAKIAARSLNGSASAPVSAPAASEAVHYDTSGIKQLIRDQLVSDEVAKEAVQYLYHQRHYRELLERYQTGIADNEERVRLSARRVGLDVDKL